MYLVTCSAASYIPVSSSTLSPSAAAVATLATTSSSNYFSHHLLVTHASDIHTSSFHSYRIVFIVMYCATIF